MDYDIFLIMIFVLAILLGSSLWIGISLGLTGTLMLALFTNFPLIEIIPGVVFNANNSFVLTCLPLFIFMGETILRTGIGAELYEGLAPWMKHIPGKLLHTNIIGCTVFAACSGSSSVTAAAVGSATIPELKKIGYRKELIIGSLAGAGTLGLLIPPSLPMIIYGGITGESIGQLFFAGIIPGLMLASLFSAYIVVRAVLSPSIFPDDDKVYSWKAKLEGLKKIAPVVAIVIFVLGSIYTGTATPTEAGAMGALISFVLGLLKKKVSWLSLKDTLISTVRITGMTMLIITGASILSICVGYLRIPQQLTIVIQEAAIPKYPFLAIVYLLYLALGFIFDSFSILLLTLPLTYPIMMELGFNGIWFGIIMVLVVEAAQITPPVGFNLFILRIISGEDLGTIAKNSAPFFLIIVLVIVIVTVFPIIATWLPSEMIR